MYWNLSIYSGTRGTRSASGVVDSVAQGVPQGSLTPWPKECLRGSMASEVNSSWIAAYITCRGSLDINYELQHVIRSSFIRPAENDLYSQQNNINGVGDRR